jgi:hypothetical protein
LTRLIVPVASVVYVSSVNSQVVVDPPVMEGLGNGLTVIVTVFEFAAQPPVVALL